MSTTDKTACGACDEVQDLRDRVASQDRILSEWLTAYSALFELLTEEIALRSSTHQQATEIRTAGLAWQARAEELEAELEALRTTPEQTPSLQVWESDGETDLDSIDAAYRDPVLLGAFLLEDEAQPYLCGVNGVVSPDDVLELQDCLEQEHEDTRSIFNRGPGGYTLRASYVDSEWEDGQYIADAYWGFEVIRFIPAEPAAPVSTLDDRVWLDDVNLDDMPF